MRKPEARWILGLSLIFAMAGCEPAGEQTDGAAPVAERSGAEARVDVEAEREAIRQADAAMLRAAQSGDAEGFAAAFAEDGRLMFPHAATAEGQGAIREKAASDFSAPGFTVEWTTESIEVAESGDLAYSTGSYTLAMETPGGPMEDEGKFLTVWRKVDGEWKVAADMIATDQPPPGQ